MTTSTFTPLTLLPLPDKDDLTKTFVGKRLDELRTPALIVDRRKFKDNCERVTKQAYRRGMKFRAHVKTHKTTEGVRTQVEAGGGVNAVVCSTMPEVWHVAQSGLVEEGKINDILYSMPVSADKMEDLNTVQGTVGSKAVIRLMVDHPEQIAGLARYNENMGRQEPWSVFIKVDGGGRRAGVPPKSEQLKELVQTAIASSAVDIYGFYSHFGQSYASKALSTASEYYQGEIDCVNTAAQVARQLGAKGSLVLSVGATPTAHAATQDGPTQRDDLEGELELHAGCYCMCDLQQFATSLVPPSTISLNVLARVVSLYPHRGEAMCDAGALAVSKDIGPLPGFGHVVSPSHATGWDLGRISQEHGTLVHRPGVDREEVGELKVGELVRIVPQHACLVCAGSPWLYVVDGSDEVVDVWVTWKGW